jgi:hypothetical protein
MMPFLHIHVRMAESATHRILSTTTGTVLVDSISSATVITLPAASQFQGKSFILQTYSTSFNVSSVTLVAQGQDTFDSGLPYYKLQQSTQTAHFIAGNDQRWYEVGGLAPESAFTSSLSSQQVTAEQLTANSYIAARNVQIDSVQTVPPFTPLQVPGLMSWITPFNSSRSKYSPFGTAEYSSSNWSFGATDAVPGGLSYFSMFDTSSNISDISPLSNAPFQCEGSNILTSMANPEVSTNFSIFIGGLLQGYPTIGDTERILFFEQQNFLNIGMRYNYDLNSGSVEHTITLGESLSTGTNLVLCNVNALDRPVLFELTVSSGTLISRIDGGLPFVSTLEFQPHYAYYLGGNNTTGSNNLNGWNGLVYDIMLFSTPVSDFDRQRIEAYYKQTPGMSNIPIFSDNPYISTSIPSFATTPITAPPFSPSTIPGLQTWLDATDIQGKDGDPVFQWRNRINSTNYFSTLFFGAQYSSTNRGVYFDGSYRQLLGDGNFFPTSPDGYYNPLFLMFVVEPTTTREMFYFYGGNSNTRYLQYAYIPAGGISIPIKYFTSNGNPFSQILGSNVNRTLMQDIIVDYLPHLSTAQYQQDIRSLVWFYSVPKPRELATPINSYSLQPYYLLSSDQIKLGVADYSNTFDASGAFTGYIHEVLAFSTNVSLTQQYDLMEYLANKYNLNSGLSPTQPGYSPTKPSMTPLPTTLTFSPSSISSCQLWLDGKDPFNTGISPSNTQLIPTWVDKSGKSNDATTQANIAPVWNYPPYYSATVSSLVFLPTSSESRGYTRYPFYNLPNYVLPYDYSQPYSIFVVARTDSVPAANVNPVLTGGVYFDPATWLFQLPVVPDPAVGYTGQVYAGGKLLNSGTFNTSNSYLHGITHGSAFDDPSITMFLNGAQTVTEYAAPPYVGAGSPNWIGKWGTAAGNCNLFYGSIQEIILYKSYLSAGDRQRVEGYLAHKWNIQLPQAHPYYTAIPTASTLSAPIFEPSSLQGLRIWFDASDPTTMTLNGSNIVSWTNKAPNGAPFYIPQEVGSTLAISNAVLSGKAGVFFNGDTFLFTSTLQLLPKPTTTFCIAQSLRTYEEVQADPTLTNPSIFTGSTYYDLVGSNYYFYFIHNPLASNTVYTYGTTAIQYSAYTLFASAPNFQLLEAQADLHMSSIRLTSFEQTLKNCNTFISPLFNPKDVLLYSTFVIGASLDGGTVQTRQNNSPGSAFYGTLCELLVYQGDLSIQARQKVEGYLSWKWGIQSNLPTTHPYKTLNPGPPV